MSGAPAEGGSSSATDEDQELGSGTGPEPGAAGEGPEPPEADWLDATTAGDGPDKEAAAPGGRRTDDVEAQRAAIRHQE